MDTKNYTGIHIKNFDLKTETGLFGDLKLFLLLFFHAIGGILWITLNRVPPTWDAALHTMLSFKFLHYIQANAVHFDIVSFLKISEYYPPFVHFTGIIIALFSGENYKALQLLGLVYFLFSILTLYLYSFSVFKNKTTAFLSAFFYSFFITNYQQGRDFMLDIPSVFFILAALYYQENSRYFTKRKETLIYSFFVGISFLTKWTSLFFFIIPFLHGVVNGRKVERETLSRRQSHVLRSLLMGAVIICVICVPWYIVNLQRFIDISKVTSIGELADPQNLLSLQNIFFNINLLSMYQLTYIGAIFFLVCLFFFLKSAQIFVIQYLSLHLLP
ncbi:MAG: glycosyltransferase family 39 protein [Candidatus Roizmanbacteria bacterium]|nr:glycosyltransferase family 39 protein [Candidatus Roizmanbacteria bacterium]